MDLQNAIMKRFLRKLVNLNIWGGRHTEVKNLQKALPAHIRGSKETKLAIKELVNRGFMLIKISTGEKHVSLMENSVDYVTVHSNSPDREFGTKCSSINQILCNSRKQQEKYDFLNTETEGEL